MKVGVKVGEKLRATLMNLKYKLNLGSIEEVIELHLTLVKKLSLQQELLLLSKGGASRSFIHKISNKTSTNFNRRKK